MDRARYTTTSARFAIFVLHSDSFKQRRPAARAHCRELPLQVPAKIFWRQRRSIGTQWIRKSTVPFMAFSPANLRCVPPRKDPQRDSAATEESRRD